MASWREGSRHFPLEGKIRHSRRYSAKPTVGYDQQHMQDCYRQSSEKIQQYSSRVDAALEGQAPSWDGLRAAMVKSLVADFPKKKGTKPSREVDIWEQRRVFRNLPAVLLAVSDLHRQLKLRVVWRTRAAQARQSSAAKTAKQRKFATRQALIDEQLARAEAKCSKDGSHSLYKVIRTFKRGRPNERVQLRDAQGRFLTASEERKTLIDYSQELFGKANDFQLKGATGSLDITPTRR